MFIDRSRFLSFTISLLVISISFYILPINQILKYISFIIIIFFLIIACPKKEFFYKKNFLLLSILFLLSFILISNFDLKFKFEIKSFNEENFDSLSKDSKKLFKQKYSECYTQNCFGKNEYNVSIDDTHYRYYLNVQNVHELRTNMFYTPGSTLGRKNNYISKYNYPYQITFDFTPYYYGSSLCYNDHEGNNICKNITNEENNFIINFIGEKIKINLIPSNFVKIINFLIIIYFSFLIFLIFKLINNFRIREKFEILYPVALIFWLIIFSLFNDAGVIFLNSYFYQYPGGDGHWYLILSNILNENLKQFKLIEFLRGGVDVFYFMPGMRYFVAIEKFLFGNSYYLHLITFLFLPFLLNKLFQIYLTKKISYLLIFSFLFFPIMHHMGFSLYQYIRYSSKVFAEPIAYTIFIYGFIRLVYYFKDKNKYLNTLPLTTIILCISCVLRPNLSSSSFFLLLIPYIEMIIKRNFKMLILLTLCGSTIFLPLAHNIYFGNEFVLFTSAVFAEVNIKITLQDYFLLLTTFEIDEDKKIMLIEIIKNFFNPFEIHKYFILIGVLLSFNYNNFKSPIILPLFILILTQFYLFLFLNPGPRYIWIFWLGSLILSIYTFTRIKILNGKKISNKL